MTKERKQCQTFAIATSCMLGFKKFSVPSLRESLCSNYRLKMAWPHDPT
jgi:hypothetical protein